MENDRLESLLRQPPQIRDNGFSAQVYEQYLLRARRQNLMLSGIWFCAVLAVCLLLPWQSLFHLVQSTMSGIVTVDGRWLTALPQGQSMLLGVIVLLLVSFLLNLPERDF